MNSYDLAAVRELLAAAFSASEISTLAFDLFQPIYQEFTPGMISSEKIKLIVAHANQHGEIPRLLTYVEKHNPYQYQRFAERLRPQTTPPYPSINQLQQQRLHDLQQNIQRSLDLLRQYEKLVQMEDDPRKLMRYRHEIDREKGAIEQYEKDAAALGPLSAQSVEGSAMQKSLDTLNQKMDALSQQLDDVDRKVAGGQVNIMAHLVKLDSQQHTHYMALTQRLDKHQVELVDLLLDAADQQQIAQWEAAQLTLLAQQALVDLHHLRQNQPDAAQWQSLIALLGQETTWDQKLKWTLPLIPGILSYESEATLDILPTLREAWERLRNRVKKDA
jgi:hypothetical protein